MAFFDNHSYGGHAGTRLLLLPLLPLLLGASTADVTRQRAPLTPGGLLLTQDTALLFPGQFAAGALAFYARNPVVWRYEDGAFDPVVRNQLIVDTTLLVGVTRLIDAGIGIPLVFKNDGPPSEELGDIRGGGVGDMRLVGRMLLVPERSFGFGLIAFAELGLPTGDNERFVGDAGLALRPGVAASWPLPKLPLRALGSFNLNVRRNGESPQFTFGDEVDVRAGVALDWSRFGAPAELATSAELSANTALAKPFSADGLSNSEIIFGATARVAKVLILRAGFAVGLTQGVGTPSYRFVFGASYAAKPPDRDGDGIPDDADACPREPEDYDRFADIDGCPERDNDEDGIPDTDDRCPDVPEDINGIVDDDGCPDEGVSDRDHDTLDDEVDRCPDEAEDFDDFQDDDGCPEPDNDEDGVWDELDQCPDEKEIINGVDDYDGCPDEGEALTEYIEDVKIEIKRTILFESGKAVLKRESLGILDQVALQILAHKRIRKIRIEGHTDSLGADEDNLFLSQDRADAVRLYLIERGVPKGMLEAVGYGETRPIDTNDTPEGRMKNRRVEFVIIQD